MEAFVAHDVTPLTLRRLNACRIYLQVVTLSDICDAAERIILDDYLRGHINQDRQSTFQWPRQPRPNQRAWETWRDTILRIYARPSSHRLVHNLGTWSARSHQKWKWFYDIVNKIVYRRDGNIYTQYTKDPSMRLPTRTEGTWFQKVGIARTVDKQYLCLCTVTRRTTSHLLLTSYHAEHELTMSPPVHRPPLELLIPSQYTMMLTYSDNDDGRTLATKLQQQGGKLVGDGSYERINDHGGMAFIIETTDELTRAVNLLPVPSNNMTITRHSNDPYRCELFSLYMGLLMIQTLEQRFNCTFAPIIVAVDNDAAVDMSIVYDRDIETTDPHHDLLRSIRSIRATIKSPLHAQHVEGHKDRYVSYENLTRIEQLNYQCDELANYARVT